MLGGQSGGCYHSEVHVGGVFAFSHPCLVSVLFLGQSALLDHLTPARISPTGGSGGICTMYGIGQLDS